MRTPIRPLFRAHAVQRYAQSKEKIVLPRLILPVRLLHLWVLLGLFLVGGIVVWLIIVGRL